MSDLIDREAAIDALRYAQHRFTVADEAGGIGTVKWSEDVIYYGAAERVLTDLPSAEPKRGKWMPHCEMSREYFGTVLVNVEYEYWFCDACGYRVEKGRPMYNFCPNCGARMED